MVSSTLNPQSIIKKSPVSIERFGEFMSGNSFLTKDTLSAAANNIVDFRNTSVTPISSNISSLLEKISSNILSQVNNSISNSTNLFYNEYDKKINSLRSEIVSKLNDLQNKLNLIEKSNNINYVEQNFSNLLNTIDSSNKIDLDKTIDSSKSSNINSVKIDLDKTISTIKLEINNLQEQLNLFKYSSDTNTLEKISSNILNQVNNSISNSTNLFYNEYDKKINSLRSEIVSKLNNLQEQINSIGLDSNIIDTKSITPQNDNIIDKFNYIETQLNIIETKFDDKINLSIKELTLENKISQNEILNNIRNDVNDVRKEISIYNIEIENLKSQINTNNNFNNVEILTQQSTSNSISPISQLQQVVETIQLQSQTILTEVVNKFSQDYEKRLRVLDENRPSKVLENFNRIYQKSIEFATYFGNKDNINLISRSLKSLRNIFSESFEISKILRETIVKIVNQLSNLPRANPSSGGLNLDINLPRNTLKSASGPNVRNVATRSGGGRRGILGLGMLGLGLGGAAVASNVSRARSFQEEQLSSSGVLPLQSEQNVPEGFIETFSNIVDRFNSAIENLLEGATSSGSGFSGGGGSSGGTSTFSGGSTDTSNGGKASSGITIADDSQGLAELGLTQEEWNAYKQGIADIEVKGQPDGGYGIMGGSGGRFAGRYQMGEEALIEAAKVLGIPRPSRQEFLSNPELQEKMYLGYTISNYRYMKNMSPEFRNMSTEQQLAVLPMAQLGIGNLTRQLRTGEIARDAWGTPTTKFSDSVQSRLKESGLGPLGTNTNRSNVNVNNLNDRMPTITPRVESNPPRVETISQPAQQVPQTISLPPTIINSGGEASQQSNSGVIPPPSKPEGSIDIPLLSTTNPDNFLTMYSRIVYNIVDG